MAVSKPEKKMSVKYLIFGIRILINVHSMSTYTNLLFKVVIQLTNMSTAAIVTGGIIHFIYTHTNTRAKGPFTQ